MERQATSERAIEVKIQNENENMRIQLLKYNDISKIEEYAITKLHMIQPDKGAAIYMDISKNNFLPSTKNVVKPKGNTIISKIKSFLF